MFRQSKCNYSPCFPFYDFSRNWFKKKACSVLCSGICWVFQKKKTCWHSYTFALKNHCEKNINIQRWPFSNSRLTIKKWTQAPHVTPVQPFFATGWILWMHFMGGRVSACSSNSSFRLREQPKHIKCWVGGARGTKWAEKERKGIGELDKYLPAPEGVWLCLWLPHFAPTLALV